MANGLHPSCQGQQLLEIVFCTQELQDTNPKAAKEQELCFSANKPC